MNRIFSFALWLDAFFKARGHKYIKRVPSGTTKTGKIRYRYIYKVGHTHRGKHVDHHDDMVEGSKFMIHSKTGEEVHLHITGVGKDGMLTIVYDDGVKKGQEETMSKDQLAQLLDKEHGVKQTLESRRKKLEDELKEMKESGRASEKQIARVQRELDRYAKKEEPEESNRPLRDLYEEYKKKVKDAQDKARREDGTMSTSKFLELYKPIEAQFKPAFDEFANDTSFLKPHTDLLYNYDLEFHKITLQDWGYAEGFKEISDYIKKYGSDFDSLYSLLDEDENFLAERAFREQGEFKTFENPVTHLEKLEELMTVYAIDHLSQNAYADKDLSFLSLDDMERLINKHGKRFRKLKGYLKEREATDIDLAIKEIERRKASSTKSTETPQAPPVKLTEEEKKELSDIQESIESLSRGTLSQEEKKKVTSQILKDTKNWRNSRPSSSETQKGKSQGDKLVQELKEKGVNASYEEIDGELHFSFDTLKDHALSMGDIGGVGTNRDPVIERSENTRTMMNRGKKAIMQALSTHDIEEPLKLTIKPIRQRKGERGQRGTEKRKFSGYYSALTPTTHTAVIKVK